MYLTRSVCFSLNASITLRDYSIVFCQRRFRVTTFCVNQWNVDECVKAPYSNKTQKLSIKEEIQKSKEYVKQKRICKKVFVSKKKLVVFAWCLIEKQIKWEPPAVLLHFFEKTKPEPCSTDLFQNACWVATPRLAEIAESVQWSILCVCLWFINEKRLLNFSRVTWVDLSVSFSISWICFYIFRLFALGRVFL